MKPNPIHRLPAPLEAAAQSIKLAAREAVERTIESLGLAALASTHAFQRDGLLAAQFELNRKSAVFVLTFNDAFDERVMREVGGTPQTPVAPSTSSWDALSLVEDREVELQISAERFGLEIGHACEWELRDFNSFAATLLGALGADTERNPLRPETVGHAMIRGIEALSDRPDVRKVLSSEISRSLSSLLRSTYADIVATLRHAGVQPRGLSVRGSAPRGASSGGSPGAAPGAASPSRPDAFNDTPTGGRAGDSDARWVSARSASAEAAGGRRRMTSAGSPGSPQIGMVDPALMALIRRLAHSGGSVDTGRGAMDSRFDGRAGAYEQAPGSGPYGTSGPSVWHADAVALPNLIRAHRDELRQAATGSVDHLVIDVIGSLFDQILSDPRLPPQMARLMARLQLPVLRAALGDPSFFSSRRHPVRRFVNRIASLGAAFDDFNDKPAQLFLAKVRTLVQEVVDGDFEQIDLYEQQLLALEAFIKAQSSLDSETPGQAAELLSQKEDEQRLRQLYAERLDGDLKALAGPQFVRDFISQVWSQVLLRANASAGSDGVLTQRLRRAGRELFMSVRPLATAAHRKTFLAELPKLMQALTEGMNLIGWPEAERRAFFGQLMPAHAEALKSPASSQLEINLLARQVEGALARPLPGAAEVKAALLAPAAEGQLDSANLPRTEARFSAEEAERIGLIDESKVAWDQPVDIDLNDLSDPGHTAAPPVVTNIIASFPGLPAADPSEAAEPSQGRALAEHVQIGFAYRMQLQGEWQKVRLAHVSAARGFFVFSHGPRLQQTLSLTKRMLTRLCESGRLLAFENGYLMDRASERARRELAGLN